MTGTLHCHLGESYLHRGDSLSLDVKPANLQGHSILSSIRIISDALWSKFCMCDMKTSDSTTEL